MGGFFERSKSMSGKSKPPVRITSTSQHGEQQQQTVLSPHNNNNENPFEFDRLNQSLKSTFDEEETTNDGPAEPSVQGAQQQPISGA